jgi:hypothetical protein
MARRLEPPRPRTGARESIPALDRNCWRARLIASSPRACVISALTAVAEIVALGTPGLPITLLTAFAILGIAFGSATHNSRLGIVGGYYPTIVRGTGVMRAVSAASRQSSGLSWPDIFCPGCPCNPCSSLSPPPIWWPPAPVSPRSQKRADLLGDAFRADDAEVFGLGAG